MERGEGKAATGRFHVTDPCSSHDTLHTSLHPRIQSSHLTKHVNSDWVRFWHIPTGFSLRIQRLSFVTTTTCQTRRETSAIRRQKFHTDDVNLPALIWHN